MSFKNALYQQFRVGFYALMLAVAAATLFVGDSAKASKPNTATLNVASAPALYQTATCGTTTWELKYGNTAIPIGTVTVSNDATNLYVTYTLDLLANPNACFGQLHVWVGNSLLNLPVTNGNPNCPGGAPIPGQFCSADGGACFDANGLTTYRFAIPFNQLNIVDVTQACNTQLFVVAHAEVDLDCTGGFNIADHETAFGGPTRPNCNRFWFYGTYTICCEFGPPPVPVCQTAFAKGNMTNPPADHYVWTTETKSNPENLPSLRLHKNRWGWALKLTAPGTYTYDLWAGAGLNKTSNGAKAGTVIVTWDGTTAIITYNIAPGYTFEEVHLYAADAPPTTTAPGQYGNLAEFDPNASTHTFTVMLSDLNMDGCVWLVAHAVVCR